MAILKLAHITVNLQLMLKKMQRHSTQLQIDPLVRIGQLSKEGFYLRWNVSELVHIIQK